MNSSLQEALQPMADLFLAASKELDRGFSYIECPHCESDGCEECNESGRMRVCECCLGTGTTSMRIDVDRYVDQDCDRHISCGDLSQFNREDLIEERK